MHASGKLILSTHTVVVFVCKQIVESAMYITFARIIGIANLICAFVNHACHSAILGVKICDCLMALYTVVYVKRLRDEKHHKYIASV
jgi:hypothetical protein